MPSKMHFFLSSLSKMHFFPLPLLIRHPQPLFASALKMPGRITDDENSRLWTHWQMQLAAHFLWTFVAKPGWRWQSLSLAAAGAVTLSGFLFNRGPWSLPLPTTVMIDGSVVCYIALIKV